MPSNPEPPVSIATEANRAWAWLQYVIQRRLAEPTPERKALWFYHIEDASAAFVKACGE